MSTSCHIQGEVERVCDYTLHGVSDDGDGMIESLSMKNDETLKDEGNIIYTLSANNYYYSVYFEIETSAGNIDMLQDNFSKEMISVKYYLYLNCMHKMYIIQSNKNCFTLIVCLYFYSNI